MGFIGKMKADKELKDMSKRFKLDDQAESKLADILARTDPDKKNLYMAELNKHLEVSNKPSAMVMMLLRKIGDGTPLGRPGPPAPGSYLDRLRQKDREKDRDRKDGDRDLGRGEDDRSKRCRKVVITSL